MKVTKYEHAGLVLDNGQAKLVIDPGEMVNLPPDLDQVAAVVITHEHYDHYSLESLQQILKANPQAQILATKSVATKLTEAGLEAQAVETQATLNLSGFEIKLKDQAHAPIWKDSPCRVITVQIGHCLYYPSDSFVTCPDKVTVLATPTSGPWLKLAEALDFAKACQYDYILPVHDYLLTDKASSSTNRRLDELVARPAGAKVIELAVGGSHDF